MAYLKLVTTKQFNGVALDCYVDADNQQSGDFWATREQIGQLLEYENPRVSVANIHNRNKERLDKYSRVIKMITHEENREVTREVTVYNFMGLLEVCRFSNQPKANEVMDFVWSITEEIRTTGGYGSKRTSQSIEAKVNEVNLERAKLLQRMIDTPVMPLSDESKAVIQHEVFKIITGHEHLAMLPQVNDKYHSATELGEMFGVSSKKIGKIAKAHNIKSNEGEHSDFGRWILSKSQHSCHQCNTFVYNSKALDWFNSHSDLIV